MPESKKDESVTLVILRSATPACHEWFQPLLLFTDVEETGATMVCLVLLSCPYCPTGRASQRPRSSGQWIRPCQTQRSFEHYKCICEFAVSLAPVVGHRIGLLLETLINSKFSKHLLFTSSVRHLWPGFKWWSEILQIVSCLLSPMVFLQLLLLFWSFCNASNPKGLLPIERRANLTRSPCFWAYLFHL